MSQFISSFLIEPVVRQARRFSRTNADSGIDSGAQRDGPDRACSEPVLSDSESGTEVEGERQESGNSRNHARSEDRDSTIQDDESDAARNTSPVEFTAEVGSDAEHLQSALASLELTDVATSAAPEAWALAEEPGLPVTRHTAPPPTSRAIDQAPVQTRRNRAGTEPQQSPAAGSLARLLPNQPQSRPFNASYPTSINEASLRFNELSSSNLETRRSSGMTERTAPVHSAEPVWQPLPEDDGMTPARQRILAIQQMDISSTEKSRMMHELMIERYTSSLTATQLAAAARAHSPARPQSQERPFTPTSSRSFGLRSDAASPETSRSSISEVISVTASDQKPTFWTTRRTEGEPVAGAETPTISRRSSSEMKLDEKVLGCQHYKRNVKLQCSQCFRWYTCRFCHDSVEDHSLIRKDTKNMLCMLCGTVQPAAGDCRSCGESAACYYCDVCKLWDNEPTRSIYHCDDCGICRVGKGLGKDFFHCKTCLACLAISIRDTHRCIERSTDCDCPICGEYMFTSPQTVVFMRCGHSIHYMCYKRHMQSSFKCPICSRSIINMEMSFRNLDLAIQSQPMPPEFQDTKAWVSCNDCCAKSWVSYHWLGLKCAMCDSYNTVQQRISTAATEDAAESPIRSPASPLQSAGNDTPTQAAPDRGRARDVAERALRTATSTSALQVPRNHSLLTASLMPRLGRSLSATDQMPSHDSSPDPQSGDASDDEVEFWGGESPRDRTEPWYIARDESDYSDDEDDVDMDLDESDDSSDDDIMDIMGHR